MAKSRSLQQAVRFALASATAAAGVTALHAQEAPAPAATAAPVEEVVVTGSRLQTPNATSISPITSVSATDIAATGLTRTEDILNNLPMVFAGQNSTVSNGSDGTSSVNLRGLGNQRTLTLVNGRRLGPGQATGVNFSDINEIPAALIERVDVLTGGASSVYGADAVAGVVNFILNTHFQGVKIDAGYTFNEHHNDNNDAGGQATAAAGFPQAPSTVNTGYTKNVSIIMGSNFADDKGNATVYATFDTQAAVLQSQYSYSTCNLGPGANNTLVCAGSGTSAKNGAGGSFRAYQTVSPYNRILNYTVDGTNGQFRPFTASDQYNFGPLNFYQRPNERWTAGGFLHYDINPHMQAYLEVMVMRNSTNAQIAASGDFGTASFTPCANPLFTTGELQTLCGGSVNGGGGINAAQGNPTQTIGGTVYPGVDLYVLRRNVEGGGRVATFVSDSIRMVTGLKGDFGDGVWTYDVYGQRSSVDNQNGNLNYFGAPQVINALNVLPGPNGPTCASVITKSDTACVPWNIWNPNGVTPAQTGYLSIPLLLQGAVVEYVVDGSITGDLTKYGIKLPTADQGLQVNVGYEWRQEESDFLPDAASQAGNAEGSGGPTPPVSGGFHVNEVFTELRLPLANHVAFADELALEGGYRYSKYSEGFDTNTYKLGLEWAPIQDVRLRGSYQRAVRAPNIAELFTPQVVGLDGSVDNCAAGLKPGSTNVLTTGFTLAQCQFSHVSPAQFGNITPNSANQYNGLLGGNPQLKPETADTYSVGFVINPRILPTLSFSVDYFDIKIKDIIGAVGGDTILNNCLATGAANFCDAVNRAPNGSLWLTPAGFVRDTNVNQGSLATKGFDIKAGYRQSMSSLGSLNFQLEGTYLDSLTTTPVTGGGSFDCAGFFGSTCGASNSKWRHVMNITWSTPWDALDLTLRWRYIGSADSELTQLTNPFLGGVPFAPTEHIPAFNYLDLSGSFAITKSVRLQLGVNNITDKAPPLVVGADCSTSSPGGANCNGNTFPGTYDPLGRFIFAHVTAQF